MIGNGADSKPQIAPPVVHFWFTTFKQIGTQINNFYVDTTREVAEKIPTWCREQTVCWSEQCKLERRGCVHGAVTTNEELKVFCGTPMDVGECHAGLPPKATPLRFQFGPEYYGGEPAESPGNVASKIIGQETDVLEKKKGRRRQN